MQIKRNTTHLVIMNSFRMEERREGERERDRDEGQIYPKIENKGRRMKTEDKNRKQESHQPICLDRLILAEY